jgi:hypothetical protein
MLLFATIFFSNLGLRLFVNGPLPNAISTPDSVSYRPSLPGPQTFPYEGQVPLAQLSAIDFLGNSLRPWLINIIMQSLRNDSVIVYFNIFFGSLSWTILLFSIMKLFNSNFFRILAASLVYVFSLTIYVFSWDRFILSEPIVNSLFITFVALLINRSRLSVTEGTDFLIYIFWTGISISRPVLGLLLTPLIFINEPRVTRKLLFKMLLVSLTCLYLFAINKNSSDKWLEIMGTPREGLSFAYLVYKDFSYQEEFISFAVRNDAPSCLFPAQNFDSDPWYLARTYKENCPIGVTWLQEQFGSKYLRFALEPSHLQTFVFGKSSITMSGVDYRKYYPYFVNRSIPLNNLTTSMFWKNDLSIFLLKIFLYIFFVIFNFFIDRRKSIKVLFGILILSFIGSISQTTLMPVDYQRLGLPGSFIFNLFLPIFVLLFLETRLKSISLRNK